MYSQSEQVDQIALALCLAQERYEKVVKDTTNPFFKSQYATLPSVIEATRTALAKEGIAVVQGLGFDAGNCTITTSLIHKSGQWLRCIAETPLSKQDAQGVGSAATYLRRYGLQAMLNISSEDDDDGNTASVKQERPQTQRAPSLNQQLKASIEEEDELAFLNRDDRGPSGMAAVKEVVKPQAKNAGNPISEGQVKRLFAIGKSKNTDVLEFIGSYGYETVEAIGWRDYKKICDAMEAM